MYFWRCPDVWQEVSELTVGVSVVIIGGVRRKREGERERERERDRGRHV